MKRNRFTEEQIIGVLREQEAGAVVAELCRKHGMSSATFYAWKAKDGGMDVSDAKRLRALEDENARLKRLYADAMLDNAGLKELVAKNGDARCQAGRGRATQGEPRGERAAGVRHPCVGAEHGPLSPEAPRRGCLARSAARAGGSASAVRIPPPACPAPRRGLDREPQQDAAALRRGGLGGAPAEVAAPDRGGAHADSEAGGAQQPLVDRLRSRSARERPPVPGADDHRRRDQAVPRRRPGPILVREAGGAGDDRADRAARPARRDRQRQRHRVHLRGGPGLHPGELDWRYIAPGKPRRTHSPRAFRGGCATNASTSTCSSR